MPHWPKPLLINIIKYDLERINKLLKSLGSPHLSCPPVIHIAGTNGKGSSAAYLRSIFKAANLKYHCYTSPHLVEFNERIIVSSEKISDSYLFEICEKTRLAAEKVGLEPTFFEATTAAAFLAFAQNPADVLILETGMGGRLDATNVIDKPLLTIITPISLDHTEYLGPTLETIAGEKAGIIKASTACIIGGQANDALEILLQKCELKNAPAIAYEYDFGIIKRATSFDFISPYLKINLPLPSLRGYHQIINSATVIAALSLGQNLFKFKDQDFITALQNTSWPGRIQKINPKQYAKLITHGQIWVDGAHNQHGAKVLADWIEQEFTSPVDIIVGMTKNRDVISFLSQFQGLYRKIYTVPVISEPLSYSSELFSELALKGKIKSIPCLSLEDALTRISSNSENIIITGSLFLAADFFKLIGTKSL